MAVAGVNPPGHMAEFIGGQICGHVKRIPVLWAEIKVPIFAGVPVILAAEQTYPGTNPSLTMLYRLERDDAGKPVTHHSEMSNGNTVKYRYVGWE